MFRRIAPAAAKPFGAMARRTYFHEQGGESGISGSTAKQIVKNTAFLFVFGATFIWRVILTRYDTTNMFLGDTTDLFEDDGTVMEGEEAVANLRIQRERIMPFMEDIKNKLDASA